MTISNLFLISSSDSTGGGGGDARARRGVGGAHRGDDGGHVCEGLRGARARELVVGLVAD